MTQLDLIPVIPPAIHGGKSAARMIAILAKRGLWTTRREFAEFGLTDRECRAGRRASHGRILYGQRGYILMRDATPDEIRACLATTGGMIKELQAEYSWTTRRAYGVLNGKEKAK